MLKETYDFELAIILFAKLTAWLLKTLDQLLAFAVALLIDLIELCYLSFRRTQRRSSKKYGSRTSWKILHKRHFIMSIRTSQDNY